MSRYVTPEKEIYVEILKLLNNRSLLSKEVVDAKLFMIIVYFRNKECSKNKLYILLLDEQKNASHFCSKTYLVRESASWVLLMPGREVTLKCFL